MDLFFQQLIGSYGFSDNDDEACVSDSESDYNQQEAELSNRNNLLSLLPEANPIVSKTIKPGDQVKITYSFPFISLPYMGSPSPEQEPYSVGNIPNATPLNGNRGINQNQQQQQSHHQQSNKSLISQQQTTGMNTNNIQSTFRTFSIFNDNQNIVFRRNTEQIENPQYYPFSFCNLKKLLMQQQNQDPDNPVIYFKLVQQNQCQNLPNHDLMCNVAQSPSIQQQSTIAATSGQNTSSNNNLNSKINNANQLLRDLDPVCKCPCVCCSRAPALSQQQQQNESNDANSASTNTKNSNINNNNQKPKQQQQSLYKPCICNNNSQFCYGAVQFESRFESGNLSRASRIGNNEYNLLLQYDINTRGYSQWFFFKVSGARAGQKIKFNIINFSKSAQLYNQGMKISVFSTKRQAEQDIGWYRGCTNISSHKNNISKRDSSQIFLQQQLVQPLQAQQQGSQQLQEQPNSQQQQQQQQQPQQQQQQSTILNNQFQQQQQQYYNTVSFSYTFDYEDDEVYFAYNPPYTYSALTQYLNAQEADENKREFFHRRLLCYSIAGNRVELITITKQASNPEEYSKRQGVFLSARVHPGEPVGSWMMQGAIDFLLSDALEARLLRERFIFKIVPMLNPDGVIHGNYRCSLVGCDLNRRWKTPSKRLHPEIYYAKQCILALAQKTNVVLVADLHGHSKKKDIFAYGCGGMDYSTILTNNNINGGMSNSNLITASNSALCQGVVGGVALQKSKEFLFLLAKLNANFNFRDCSYIVEKYKEGTARVALWRELKIFNVYTIEASFCGPSSSNTHFSLSDLKNFGMQLCKACLVYFFQEKQEIYKHISISSPKNKLVQAKQKSQPQQQQEINNNSNQEQNPQNQNQLENEKEQTDKNINQNNEEDNNVYISLMQQLRQQKKFFLDDLIVFQQNKSHPQQQLLSTPKHNSINHNNSELNISRSSNNNNNSISNESESEPSVDNLSEEELNKLLPTTKKSAKKDSNSNNKNNNNNTQTNFNKTLIKKQINQTKTIIKPAKQTYDSLNQANKRRDSQKTNCQIDNQSQDGQNSKLKNKMSRQSSIKHNDHNLLRLSNRLYNFIKSDKITVKKRENRSEELKIAILEPKFINFNSNIMYNKCCLNQNNYMNPHQLLQQQIYNRRREISAGSQNQSNNNQSNLIYNNTHNQRMRKLKQDIQNRIAVYSCQGIQQDQLLQNVNIVQNQQQKNNISPNYISPGKNTKNQDTFNDKQIQIHNNNNNSQIFKFNKVDNQPNQSNQMFYKHGKQSQQQNNDYTQKTNNENVKLQAGQSSGDYIQTESSIYFNDNQLINGHSNLLNNFKINDSNNLGQSITFNNFNNNNTGEDINNFQQKLTNINKKLQILKQNKQRTYQQKQQYYSLFGYQQQNSQNSCFNTLQRQESSSQKEQQDQRLNNFIQSSIYDQQTNNNLAKKNNISPEQNQNSNLAQQIWQYSNQKNKFLVNNKGALNQFNQTIRAKPDPQNYLNQKIKMDSQRNQSDIISDLSNSLIVRNKVIAKPKSAYSNRSKSQISHQCNVQVRQPNRVLIIEDNFP